MNEVLNVLCLEDSPRDAEIMRELLIDAGYDLNMDCTATEKEFVSFLRSHKYDIILSDFKLPGFDGFTALRWSVEICPDVPFICVSGTVGEETAVELLKKGAVDYILKDRLERLPSAIQRALNEVKEKKVRQKSEESLRESERKLREAQEMAHLGFWTWDIKTGNVEWSEEVFKIFCIDPKEFTPHIDSILALSPWPEDNQRDKELINRAIETHNPGSYEQKFLRPDKSIGHYYSTFQGNYNEDGNLISIVGTVLDITERKQAEEAIQILNKELEQRVIERTSQLEAANKELEAFSYSVSHDLRAPLRAVDGFSKFVLEDYENKLDSEGKRLLNLIRSNIQKMDQLITDLLALSRVARSDMNFSDIDMTQMAISMFKETAAPDVSDKLSLQVDPLPEAYADPTYIRQVWANLIANAIKFSSKEKKPSIKICGRTENGFNVYYVKDNGVGFNPEYTHKLFGVFQRLHKSDDFEGTGVGLAIVQRIIHRHGGKVWAEGAEGKGATFYFSVPVKK
jgi:PAS domain S-box-containing protein